MLFTLMITGAFYIKKSKFILVVIDKRFPNLEVKRTDTKRNIVR